MVSEKPAMGRRKIKIEKICKKNHLQVTFSKRRAGLFKKASELSTLCGVDIAVIVFSPAQKAFSFGHPDVDSITRRFLSGSPSPPSSGLPQLIGTRRNANAHDQNVELTRILDHIEAEKKYGQVLDQMRRADRSRCCWESPIEELELHELEQLRGALEELKKAVAKQVINNILIEPTSSLPFLAVNGGGEVGDFGAKLEIDNASSAALHFNNFGYAQKIC